MSYTVSIILNVLLILVENLSILVLAGCFFKIRRRPGAFAAAFCVFFLAAVLYVLLFGSSIVKYIAGVVVCGLFLYYCYASTSIVKCFFTAAFWLAYLVVGDAVLLSLIGFLFRTSVGDLMQSPESYYFMIFGIKIAELFLLVVLRTWMKARLSTKAVSGYDWLRSMYIPLSCLLLGVLLYRIYYLVPDFAGELLLCSLILLIVEFSSVFLMDYLDRQAQASYDNAILRQSMKAQVDNVAAWQGAYAGLRKQSHDIDNHLLAIQGLVKNDAPKSSVLDYLDSIRGENVTDIVSVKTNRMAADIILSQKLAVAKSKDIKFNLIPEDLSRLPLSDEELVTVLANLLDNAIEAVDQVREASRRYITLKLRAEQDVFFLYCENPTDTVVDIRDGRIKTTKQKARDHGYGIRNVEKVLDEHNDIYSFAFNREQMLFSFSAQMS